MAQQIPEGEFYSRLYVDPGPPQDDSDRFRNRVAAFFSRFAYDPLGALSSRELGQGIEIETGYQGFGGEYYRYKFEHFFRVAPLIDVFTGITLTWRQLNRPALRDHGPYWKAFIDRAFKEENLKYRVDSKCGIHPFVDREFERNRVSVLACLDLLIFPLISA